MKKIKTKNNCLLQCFIVIVIMAVIIYAILFRLILNESVTYIDWYICILFIGLLFPLIKIGFRYLHRFVYYMFCTSDYSWLKEIERPRLLFYIFGLIFIWLSGSFIKNSSIDTKFVMIFSYLFLFIGIGTMSITWTKFFEIGVVKQVQRKINLGNLKCIINSYDYNIDAILLDLSSHLKCSSNTFNNLVNLDKIEVKDRIKCNYKKTELIRFVCIFFNLQPGTPHDSIKTIIKEYFMTENEEEYHLKDTSASEISKIISSEHFNPPKKYLELRESLNAVFERNKKKEI